jgi:SAM-dependent methyltransferase
MSNVEDSVRSFYDTKGWSGGEDALFRQFRPAYRKYHAGTTERTIGCFAGKHGSLLIVGGGDLPQSHVSVATQFEQTACADISKAALDISQEKLPKARKILGSICDLHEEASSQFDCIFAAHVIYHIDAQMQEKAVREMVRLVKPGGRIVILYSNPKSPIRFAAGALHRLRKMFTPKRAVEESGLYFSPHPLGWWQQFESDCKVSMLPWDVIGSYEERTLIWSDLMASAFYPAAGLVERAAPGLAVKLWQYPIVILDKR